MATLMTHRHSLITDAWPSDSDYARQHIASSDLHFH